MSAFPAYIIHADDDPLIHGLVERALGDAPGLKLRFCDSGRELIDMLTKNPPELVLLDLSMPGMDGLGALRELHKNQAFRNVLIILMTGHVGLKMQEDFKALGIIGIIHKPFSPGMLPERIRYLWHLHHTGEDIEIHSRM
ncbi:MAG TPA: response regulator [Alphaproteobacteria bacterium]|nr:response regulator [Alphaproteobacteria bacterium]